MIKRQIQILKVLHQTEGFTTFQKLADLLGVSVKTIRNDSAAIREFLQQNNMGNLESKPHLGIRTCINESEWEKLLHSGLFSEADAEEDRKILFFILVQLLRHGSLTAQRLAEQYYISRTQLDKILETANAWFFKNRIAFERRRGKGISIQYSEFNYRLALLDFYLDFKEEIIQMGISRSPRFAVLDEREYNALCNVLDGFDVDNIAEAVSEIETRFGFRFSYTSNVALLLLAALCIIRTRKGKIAQVPLPPPCRTDGLSDELVAAALAEELQKRFSIQLPQEEQVFLLFVIAVSEVQGFENDRCRRTYEAANVELCQFTVKFVNLVSAITNVDLRDDKFFVTQMFLQLKAMIARLKYQTGFKNPLLRQIKAKYPNLMAMAWSASNMFEKDLRLDINEHEVAYLALHIGGAIERSSANLRACIVCDYGIGISQILREKIERALPELRITAVLSNRDRRSIRNEACDFIISTVPMDGGALGKPMVTVAHLLDGSDIAKIEEQMRKTRAAKRSVKKGLAQAMPTRSLFMRELIWPDAAATGKSELLRSMCARLESLGYVTPGFEASVLEREAHTSTEVGKGIALPHGHSQFVNRSVVAVAKLTKPLDWFEGSDEVDLVFLLAVDLDEAAGMKDEIIKFYKSFVGFMEDGAAQARLRALHDEGEVIKLLENW